MHKLRTTQQQATTMKKGLTILTTILTVLISCKQTVKEDKYTTTDYTTTEIKEAIKSDLKTIKLDFDFVVSIGQEEDFKKFKTYTFFQLTRNNTIIYVDSSLTEYEFGDELFPIIIKTGDNVFELLFEVNDRPSNGLAPYKLD